MSSQGRSAIPSSQYQKPDKNMFENQNFAQRAGSMNSSVERSSGVLQNKLSSGVLAQKLTTGQQNPRVVCHSTVDHIKRETQNQLAKQQLYQQEQNVQPFPQSTGKYINNSTAKLGAGPNQYKQDTSPMRVTLDLTDANRQNVQNNVPAIRQDLKQSQVYSSRGPSMEVKLNQYLNTKGAGGPINQQNRNSRMSNLNGLPSGQANHTYGQQQVLFSPVSLQNDNKVVYTQNSQVRPSYQNLSRQHSQFSQQPAANQFDPQQSIRYDQFAQNYSLETLIKQAQKKKLSTQGSISSGNFDSTYQNPFQNLNPSSLNGNPQQLLVQQQQQQQQLYNFNNKIENFEGDNDCVDEEYESSAEKRAYTQSNQMKMYYDEGSMDSDRQQMQSIQSDPQSEEEEQLDQENNQRYSYDQSRQNVQRQQILDENSASPGLNEEEDDEMIYQQNNAEYQQDGLMSFNRNNQEQEKDEEDERQSQLSDEEQFIQLQSQIQGQNQLKVFKNQLESPSEDYGISGPMNNESEYGMSSDSKYRLSMTPNTNNLRVPESRFTQLFENQNQNNRIFTDLSSKVVNVNPVITQLQNPFSSEIDQALSNVDIKPSLISYYNEQTSKNSKDQDSHETNYLSANCKSFQPDNQVPQNSVNQQKNQTFQVNSDVCNYESLQQRQSNPLQNTQGSIVAKQDPNFQQPFNQSLNEGNTINAFEKSKLQNISPFDMMRNEYLNSKQKVVSRYQDSGPQSEAHDNFQAINLMNQKQQQIKQVVPLKIDNQAISSSTAQFFEQLKPQDKEIKKQVQTQDNKFMSFDDFMNRDSVQQPNKRNIGADQKQAPNLDLKIAQNQMPFSQNQSPRKNKADSQASVNETITNKTQVQNSRIIISKSPRPDQQQREKELELKKKREIEMLKLKAIEKEQMRLRRIESAVKIQKCIRGFFERRSLKKLQENFRFYRKFRRMMSIAYGKYRLKFLQGLVKMMTQAHENKKMMEDDMFKKYVDHCVVFIQKVWKGYRSRRFLQAKIIQKYKQRRALNSVVKGWKIRRIISSCREVIDIKRDLIDIEKQFGLAKGPKDPLNAQIMQQRKKKIEELSRLVPQLYKNGRWIFSIQRRLVQVQQIQVQKQQQQSNNQLTFGHSKMSAHQNAKSQIFNQSQGFKRDQRPEAIEHNRDFSPIQNQSNKSKPIVSEQQNSRRKDNYDGLQFKGQRILETDQEQAESSVVVWPSHRFNNQLKNDEPLYSERNEIMSDIPGTHRSGLGDKFQNLQNKQGSQKTRFIPENADSDMPLQQNNKNQNKRVNRQQQEGYDDDYNYNQEFTLRQMKTHRVQPLNRGWDEDEKLDNRNNNNEDDDLGATQGAGGGIMWLSHNANTAKEQKYLSNQNSTKKTPFHRDLQQKNDDQTIRNTNNNKVVQRNRPSNLDDEDEEFMQNEKNSRSDQKQFQFRSQNAINKNQRGQQKAQRYAELRASQENNGEDQQQIEFYPRQQKSNAKSRPFEENEDDNGDFYELSNGYRGKNNKRQVEDRPLQKPNNQDYDRSNPQQNNKQNFGKANNYNDWEEDQDDNDNEEDRPVQRRSQNDYESNGRVSSLQGGAPFMNIDDMPIKPAKTNIYQEYMQEERSVENIDNKNNKKKTQAVNIDDIPIKPKRNPTFDQQDLGSNSAEEEKPIKTRGNKNLPPPVEALYSSVKFGSELNDSQVVPPKYNFEEMLERALQEQGGDQMAQDKKKANQIRRAKTTRPNEDSDSQQEDAEELKQNAKGGTVKNKAKKDNLKKRQKYDPRKAIEEAKKKEDQAKVEGPVNDKVAAKSVFPKGFLNPDQAQDDLKSNRQEDRIRSKTSQPKTQEDDDKGTNQDALNARSVPKRKTLKQAQAEKSQHQVDNVEEPSQDGVSTANASSNANGAKPFLKRKTQAVKFQKLDWKVRSRIDCWTNKNEKNPTIGASGVMTNPSANEKELRSQNISQTRRKTSGLRSPRPETSSKEEVKGSFAQQKKAAANQNASAQSMINIQQVQTANNSIQAKTANHSITNSFSQVPIQQLSLLPQSQLSIVQNSKSVLKLDNFQSPQFQAQDETLEIESIPDENEHFIRQSNPHLITQNQNLRNAQMIQVQQDLSQSNQNDRKIEVQVVGGKQNQWDSNSQLQIQGFNVSMGNIQNRQQLQSFQMNSNNRHQVVNQDPIVQPNSRQFQQTISNLNFQNMMNEYSSTYQSQQNNPLQAHNFSNQTFNQLNNNFQSQQQLIHQDQPNEGNQDSVTLKLEELERVFEMFHPKQQDFSDCQIQDLCSTTSSITSQAYQQARMRNQSMTVIPHMSTDSMFFNCYADDIYETILDELKINYNALCNENYD